LKEKGFWMRGLKLAPPAGSAHGGDPIGEGFFDKTVYGYVEFFRPYRYLFM
jgi:hypothetical protein